MDKTDLYGITDDELREVAMFLLLAIKDDLTNLISLDVKKTNSFYRKVTGKDLLTGEEIERLSQ